LDASPNDSPSTETEHRKLRPVLACKDKARRKWHLGLLKAFWIAYREARRRFVEGQRSVIFPAGTYRFQLWGLRCEAHGRLPIAPT
jgi:hypothetical protein